MPDYQIFYILYYQTVSTCSDLLSDSFLLPFSYLGSTNNHSIPLGYVLQLLVHGRKGTLLCFLDLLFPTWDSEGLPGDCGSGLHS